MLLLVVSVPFIRKSWVMEARDESFPETTTGLTKVRRVNENEVIAQFLESEFFQEEYKDYREIYADLVTNPDLSDARENAIRRRQPVA